jgi:SAM-dependent methyltransferase
MRSEEARTIARWLSELRLPEGAVCLNVGSSTGKFRDEVQPHIGRELFAPLLQSGIRVVHCDMKEADGVDEIGDVLDPAFRAKLRAYNARVMICSNLLEHLEDPYAFAAACGELVAPGGYGIVSVPRDYPYHPDPIDTLLRPSPKELAAMLPDWELQRGEVLVSGTYLDDLRASGRPMHVLTRQLVRAVLPFYRPTQWRHITHRLLWLFRRYKVSIVLLRRPA